MENIKAVCLILQQISAQQPKYNTDIYLLFTEQSNSKTAASCLDQLEHFRCLARTNQD